MIRLRISSYHSASGEQARESIETYFDPRAIHRVMPVVQSQQENRYPSARALLVTATCGDDGGVFVDEDPRTVVWLKSAWEGHQSANHNGLFPVAVGMVDGKITFEGAAHELFAEFGA